MVDKEFDRVSLISRKLNEIRFEANHFGIKLGLKITDTENVCDQSHKISHECLQNTLSYWLKQTSPKPTWNILVQALKSVGEHVVGKQVIAYRIKKCDTLDQSVSVPLPDLLSQMEGINATHWRSLGLHLRLSLSQINEIDDNGGWSVYVMTQLLSLWLSGNGKPATLDNLVTAVKELKKVDLANELAVDSELSNLLPAIQSDRSQECDATGDVIQQRSNAQLSESTIIQAMKEGGWKMKPCNIILHGPPGVGKTSLKRVILGQPPLPKEKQNATHIVENAARAVSVHRLTAGGRKSLAEVDNAEMIKMLAEKAESLRLSSHKQHDVLEPQHAVESVSDSLLNSETLQSIKEQLAEQVEPSSEIFDVDWFYLMDSGGQPQFLDVLPLPVRNESLQIVVIRLDEGLEDKPKVRFYNKGEDVYTLPDHLTLSNREFIERACQIAEAQAMSGKFVPKVMVVGTHIDKLGINCKAKLKEINKELTKIHQKYNRVLIRKSKDEVIFAMNAMAPVGEERQQYTEELQACILKTAEETGYEIVVPLKWLAFHLDLEKKGGVVRKSECYKTGEILGMGRSDVEEALKFFKKVGLLFYYPDDVPDLVFTKMGPLIGRLSRLITASFITPGSSITAPYKRLREKGLFNKSFLSTIFEDLYNSEEEFTDDDFLKLLECLKIAVHVEDDDYFLPSVLSLEPPVDDSPFPMSCVPLVYSWGEQILPHGFFLTFVVELLRRQKGRDKIYFQLREHVIQCRDVIQVIVADNKIPGFLKLVDRKRWIEICYSCSTTNYCSKLREITSDAVERVVKRFEHTGIESPKIGFRCCLCDTDDHCCVLSRDQRMVQCNQNNGPVTPDMLCWIACHTHFSQDVLKDLDLPHGAIVVAENEFHVGNHKKSYMWDECGFRLDVPEGALSSSKMCIVVVKAIIAGQFVLPENTELVSALYAIPPHSLQAVVKIGIQHCVILKEEAQSKHLRFIKAHQTQPGTSCHFSLQEGGDFDINSHYGELCTSEVGIVGIVYYSEQEKMKQIDVSSLTKNTPDAEEDGPAPTERGKLYQYRAHTFYEKVSTEPNSWNFLLVAVKNLKVHVKHVVDSLPELEKGGAFVFHFLEEGSQQYIGLKLKAAENIHGWKLKPHILPCQVTKVDIDLLEAQQLQNQDDSDPLIYHYLPMCKVAVFAGDDANHDFDSEVPVEGITGEKKIVIQRFLHIYDIQGYSLFKRHMSEMLGIISDPERLAIDLSSVNLIPCSIRDDVISKNISRYQKAKKLLSEIERSLRESKSKRLDILVNFCDVLKKQQNPVLTKIAEDMSTEINNQTSKQTSPVNHMTPLPVRKSMRNMLLLILLLSMCVLILCIILPYYI